MSGDCQEIVRRLPLQSRFFFSLLRQETTRMLSSGESELWRLQVQSYECWKKTSENPWFCVFCVLFFQTVLVFWHHVVSVSDHDTLSATEMEGFHFLCPGKGEREEHYALVYLANLYFEAASHYKTLPAAKDPISQPHFLCPCRPCFKVLPWTLKEPADQWYLV